MPVPVSLPFCSSAIVFGGGRFPAGAKKQGERANAYGRYRRSYCFGPRLGRYVRRPCGPRERQWDPSRSGPINADAECPVVAPPPLLVASRLPPLCLVKDCYSPSGTGPDLASGLAVSAAAALAKVTCLWRYTSRFPVAPGLLIKTLLSLRHFSRSAIFTPGRHNERDEASSLSGRRPKLGWRLPISAQLFMPTGLAKTHFSV
jgi:hypothetical protein